MTHMHYDVHLDDCKEDCQESYAETKLYNLVSA